MTQTIALYSPNMYGGGAERVTLNVARELARRDIPVDLVLASAVGEYLKEVPPEVRVVDLESKSVLRSVPALIKYFREESPAAMLSTQMHANVIALVANALARTQTRIVVREANIVTLPSDRMLRMRVHVILFLARLLYPRADDIIAVSKGVAQSLYKDIGLPLEYTTVIYNPVVRAELYAKAREAVDHPWFIENGVPIILSVGRLEEQKDFSTLIRAFSIARQQINARLVIFGEGSQRYELQKEIDKLGLSEDISLPGFTHNPYVYMSRASVYVLSSAWEGLPNTLIEAMALGTPVVATDCESGPREILADGKYGYLAPVGNAERLAEGILAALTQNEYPLADSAAMMEFHVDRSVDKYLQTLCSEHVLHS